MSSKRIKIFKKASNSLKISLKCHEFLKKASHSQKQIPCGYCPIAISRPRILNIYNFHGIQEFSKNKNGRFIQNVRYFVQFFLQKQITISILLYVVKQTKFD
jgi:hypothetical protein